MKGSVLVLGAGDMGSAVAHALHAAGWPVAIQDDPAPAHPRRGMAFADALWDGCAIATLLAIAMVAAATAGDYGVSNDEYVQQLYGEKLLSFYSSGFSDWSAFHYKDLFYYGGLFDLTGLALRRAGECPSFVSE